MCISGRCCPPLALPIPVQSLSSRHFARLDWPNSHTEYVVSHKCRNRRTAPTSFNRFTSRWISRVLAILEAFLTSLIPWNCKFSESVHVLRFLSFQLPTSLVLNFDWGLSRVTCDFLTFLLGLNASISLFLLIPLFSFVDMAEVVWMKRRSVCNVNSGAGLWKPPISPRTDT